MANNCWYEMLVKGRKEDCDKWLAKMKSYDEPNHFWRIFEAVVDEEHDDGGEHCMRISGDCAWSLQACCREGGYSDVDLFAVNTKDLHLKMEVYSSELGCEFQEHYIYKYGECVTDECVDYCEYYWDKRVYPDFEDFKKDYEPPEGVTEKDFDDEDACRIGGFPVWDFSI